MCSSALAQLSGSYTIGASGNYTTIDAAVSALNSNGVSGAVTFTIASGTYTPPTGGWNINAITGASATNTITFKPAASATVVISGSTNNQYGVFNLSGTKYLIFDGSNSGGTDRSMTIRNTYTTYGSAFTLKNGSQLNVFKNCVLQASGYATSYSSPSGYGGIFFIGGTTGTAGNDSNLIQNNTLGDVTGTYRSNMGIVMCGQSTTYPNKGNKIIGNDIVNFGHNVTASSYPSGVWVYSYNSGTVIQKNDIHMTIPAAYYYMYPIYNYNYAGYSPNTVIDGNRLWGFASNYTSYIYVYAIYDYHASATASSYTQITNNMISLAPNYSAQMWAIYHYGDATSTNNRVDVINNSIYMGGTDASTYSTYATQFWYAGKTNQEYFNFRNNVIHNNRIGGYNYGMYIYPGAAAPNYTQNYNVLNMMSPTTYCWYGYWYNGSTSGQPNTLAGWKSLTALDTNSSTGNPQYIDPDNCNLHISTSVRTPAANAGAPFNKASGVAVITTDYDGDTRSTSTPDAGADEGSFLPLLGDDMMAQAFVTPKLPPNNIVRGSTTFTPVGIIYNTGTNTASNFTARFRIFNNSGGALVYDDQRSISSLAALTVQTVTFGTTGSLSGSTSLSPGTYTIELRTEYSSDLDTSNNARYSTIVVKNPLCGNYTINPAAAASSTNYQSFTAAIADLNGVGITCATTFLVSSGTYTATTETFPLVLGQAPGMSATNTVTFKPATGATVTMTGNTAGSMILFDQGDYFTLDGSNATGGTTRNWTIENQGSSPAVKMVNGATYNTVKNLSMRANNAANSYSSLGGGVVAIEMLSLTYVGNSYNVIQNNLIGDTTGTIRSGIGVHLFGGTNATTSTTYQCINNRVEDNDIVNFGAGTTGYGLNMSYYMLGGCKILRNKIHNTTTTNASTVTVMYGIMDYYRIYGGGNDTIAYNKIYSLISGAATTNQYGFYNYYTNGGFTAGTYSYSFQNNLIALRGASTPYGMLIQYSYSNWVVAHNTIDVVGTSGTYGLYWYYNYANSAFKNNIFRRTSSGNYMFYMYYADYSTFAMDRNIYGVGATSQSYYWYSASGSAYSGTISGTDLTAWRSATGRDANSVMISSAFPYVDSTNYDYHINPQPVYVGESRGEPIGISQDFDGDTRSAQFPDIGADEGNFNGGGIRVVSPNGGEQATSGAPYLVTFTTNRVMQVRIELTTNGGANWLNAGTVSPTNVGTNTFTFTMPDTVVNNARIRVMSQVNQWEGDTSDANFSLVRPIIVVLAPNGGERLVASDTTTISWTSQFIPPGVPVQLDYSTNNGSTWLPIAASVNSPNLPATNNYTWIIPNTPSTQALMRVKLASATINDVSNATFTIITIPNVQITSPNGGEQWFVGEKKNITWTSVSTDNVGLEYSINGGASWIEIANRIPAYANSYEWLIPNSPTNNALVRVSNKERTRFVDVSDAPFQIQQSTIIVTSPNGGEKYDLNQPIVVSWTAQNATTVRVEYSSDNGSTWSIVGQGVAAGVGSYSFTPPQIPTKLALVRVVNADRDWVQDRSDRPFEIMEPKSITVYTPGEGDELLRGSTTNIMWSAPRINSVSIEYSSNGGTSYSTVASNISAATGSYSWNVPNTTTKQGKIRIREVGGTITGESGLFSIVDQVASSIRVIRPNGGESYMVGNEIMVQWTASSDLLKVSVLYSTNSGTNWTLINNSVSASVGQYKWTAPNMPGTQYRVKVDAGVANDASDADFAVTAIPDPKITVLAPNGGENLTVDSTSVIRWTTQDITGNLDISYSTDNGTTWLAIATVPSTDQTYDWKVPNTLTTQGLVQVEAADKSAKDASNGVFSISEKVLEPIIVVTPNGGDNWMEGDKHNIVWTGPADISQVKLQYSTDGGTSWKDIANSASIAGSNTYEWTIPQVLPNGSTSMLVKVSSMSDARYDVSDNVFSVTLNPAGVTTTAQTGAAMLSLMGNFPNPFAAMTEVRWYQGFAGEVTVSVYDGTGRLVSWIPAGRREAGEQRLDVQAGELAGGVYYYELRCGLVSARGMMMVVR
jgi:hypothetical protein